MTLTAENILVVGAAVLSLVQLLKWSKVIGDNYGPIAVLVLALAGVVLFQISEAADGAILTRADIWPIFSAWIAVSFTSAGAFGFTRAAASAVTSTRAPPQEESLSRRAEMR